MYKATHTNTVIRLEDGAFIPADPANIDYQQYQAWLFAGNEPAPADTPAPAQLIAATLAKARAMRLDIFKVLDGLQVSAVVNANTQLAQQIEACKQALRDLPQQVNLTGFTTAKQMEDAIQAAYFAVAAQAPASIRSAFAAIKP